MSHTTTLLRSRWFIVTVVGVLPALAIGYWLGVSSVEQGPTVVNAAEGDGAASDKAAGEDSADGVSSLPVVVEFPEVGSAPRSPGVWSWEELRGGECLSSFEGPFVSDFRVVGCDQPHQAEFHRAQLLDDDPTAQYPGDQFVRDRAGELCAQWDLAALNNPGRYDDLVVVPSYSIGQAQWAQGERVVGCFIYRESGKALDDLLVR